MVAEDSLGSRSTIKIWRLKIWMPVQNGVEWKKNGTLVYDQLDDAVLQWFQQQNYNYPVNGLMLKIKTEFFTKN